MFVRYPIQSKSVYVNLPMQNFIRPLKEIKSCSRKPDMTWWVDHPMCSRIKQSLTKFSFGNRLICATQLLVLMRVNCIPIKRVSLCQKDFTRVEVLIQWPADLHRDRTRPAALKIWSCPIFNEQDQNVKLKAPIKHTDREKFTASVLMGFVLIGTLSSMLWVVFITFAPARKYVPLSLKKVSVAWLKWAN